MRRYLVHKDGRLIGGVEASARTAKMLREHGYRLLPA